MGAGSSKNPEVGVPINPRVNYAAERSRKEKKTQLIDAPVLVKVDHGTLRYRYKEDDKTAPSKKKGRTEVAHEGPERSKKHGYFFHTTLNDFSEDASYNKEESWKFHYVYKGPNRAKQKKVYYVYGKGLQNAESSPGGIIRESSHRPEGKGYQWPAVYKVPGHVYYDLSFLPQEEDAPDDEDKDVEHVEENSHILINVGARDRIKKLTKRLAVRLVKPAISIHLFHQQIELGPEVMVSELRVKDGSTWKRIKIQLIPQ